MAARCLCRWCVDDAGGSGADTEVTPDSARPEILTKHDQSICALSLGQWNEGYEPSDKTSVTCFPQGTFRKWQVAQRRNRGLKKPQTALTKSALNISLTATDGRTEAKGRSYAIPSSSSSAPPVVALTTPCFFFFNLFSISSLPSLFLLIASPPDLPHRHSSFSSLYPSNKATIVAGF